MTTLKCKTCKKKFERIQVRPNKYGHFCTRACFGAFKSKYLVGDKASHTKFTKKQNNQIEAMIKLNEVYKSFGAMVADLNRKWGKIGTKSGALERH